MTTVRRAAVWSLAVSVGSSLLLACTPGLDEVAADQPAFEACVDERGLSLEGSEDWSTRRSQEFWSQPGALDCALDELDTDARQDALAAAFPDNEDVEAEGGDEERVAQLEVLAAWAEEESRTRTVEQVVARAEPLLASTWYADLDYPGANGAARTIVLAAMRARGELPSYEAYLDRFPQEEDGVDLRLRVASDSGTVTPEEYRTSRDIAEDLVTAIGSG